MGGCTLTICSEQPNIRADMSYFAEGKLRRVGETSLTTAIRIIPARVPQQFKARHRHQFIHQPGLRQRARQSRSASTHMLLICLPNCIISTTGIKCPLCAGTLIVRNESEPRAAYLLVRNPRFAGLLHNRCAGVTRFWLSITIRTGWRRFSCG